MFIIDKDSNRIEKIKKMSFAELGFGERNNLQEWIANNPSSLGDSEESKLLIIQKEFDGFGDTRERLDLLALDRQGNLVIIENKLDDTGRDVTWQALKYASYCSSLISQEIYRIYQQYLDKEHIKGDSETLISEFLDNDDVHLNENQRIIFVAANYRKEVTSTVMWLISTYKMDIQCFKATPYKYDNKFFLKMEQIIPVKEAADYTIKMAAKVQDDLSSRREIKSRDKLRKDFWTILIDKINESNCSLYKNISPSFYNWIGAGSGVRGVGFNFAISKNYIRAELYIDRGDYDENKLIFENLYSQKETIESAIGEKLVWERLDDKRACRIKYENSSYNVFERSEWNEMINFLVHAMTMLEKGFKEPVKNLNRVLKNGVKEPYKNTICNV